MKLRDYYKYSWFANLSYVQWGEPYDIGSESDPDPRVDAAIDELRVPLQLAEKIFDTDRWHIPNDGFVVNDD